MSKVSYGVNWLFNQLKSRGYEDMVEFQRLLEIELDKERKASNLKLFVESFDSLYSVNKNDICSLSFVLNSIVMAMEGAIQNEEIKNTLIGLVRDLHPTMSIEKLLRLFISFKPYVECLYYFGEDAIEKSKMFPIYDGVFEGKTKVDVKRYYKILKPAIFKLKKLLSD